MVTWNEYLKSIFEKVIASYSNLAELTDKPGDLQIIERELFKITGYFHVAVTKLRSDNYQSKGLSFLKPKIENYLESYSFEKEIETMALLYSEDTSRIKNLRLKILESLEDNKLMERIKETIEEL